MIQVKHLSKNFKVHKKNAGLRGSISSLFKREYVTKKALADFSLDVKEGEIIGLIGANGAGKTTLTKILSGIIHPSSGEVSVLGFTPWKRDNRYRSQMAVIMGQKAQLWWDLPAMDGFLLLKEIYKIPEIEFHETVNYLAKYLEIKDQLNIQVRRLSLGERMKVELMAALIHKPKVIFLDEPTIGLDITAQKSVRRFLKKYREEHNATMILTSHYMDDIEELCSRIVILKDGQKVYDDELDTFKNQFAIKKIIVAHCSALKDNPNKLDTFPQHLGKVEIEGQRIQIVVDQEKSMESAKFLIDNIKVDDLTIQNAEIADLIENLMIHGDAIS